MPGDELHHRQAASFPASPCPSAQADYHRLPGIPRRLSAEACRKQPHFFLGSFAGYKGDIDAFVEGAAAIHRLTVQSRVLIAEACTHAPLTEDIGTVKIPRLLRKRIGEELQIDFVSGNDFPKDLSRYDLIIHCGACMFNRRYVLNRIAYAQAQCIPITNYGVALASLNGILDKIVFPHSRV